MKYAHFLCNINHDNWAGYVGTLLLVSFGPQSRAYLQQAYQELQATDHELLGLNETKLVDFSVRQVLPHNAKAKLEAFCEQVRESDNPLLVPQDVLASVLRRAEADDDLRISSLPIYQQGSLELMVYLTTMFNGRAFLVDGAFDLRKMAADFPATKATGPARTIRFRGSEYKLKPGAVLAEMPADEQSIDASAWILRNTYARGYSKTPAQSLPPVGLLIQG